MGLIEQRPEYRSWSDDELLEAARGDLDAFGELIRRHQDFVFGAAMRIVRDPVLAEDLAQDAFLRAHRALPDFRGESHVRSWLYRIVSNLALNAVQRRREYPSDSMPEQSSTSSPARQAELTAMGEQLERAIRELPDDQRIALALREFDGLSYQEIAHTLDLPINTVRTRILRARRALQTKMEPWR